jgi:hypothetical protein
LGKNRAFAMNNTGGGEIRRGKVKGLTGNFLLVPKLPLGNPLDVRLCCARLILHYKEILCFIKAGCPSGAWAKICVPKQELGNEMKRRD